MKKKAMLGIAVLVFLIASTLVLVGCAPEQDEVAREITREDVLSLSLEELRSFLTEEDINRSISELDRAEILDREILLNKLTREDVINVLGPEGVLEIFKDGDYDYDYAKYGISLLKASDSRKCIGAHSAPIKSQINGTHGFDESFDGLGVVMGNYVLVPEAFAPDIEELENRLSEQISAQSQFPPLPPGMPPPPPEIIGEDGNQEAEEVELHFAIALSVGENIELLEEVARDEASGVVLFERKSSAKRYSVPQDCPIMLADTSLLEVELGKSYDVGIAGHHPAFRGKNEITAVEYGYLVDINEEEHEFRLDQVSVLPWELGGAVYLGMDGEPHLAAMIVRNRALSSGYETIAIAVDINYLIEVFKEKGFELFP